MNIKWSLRQQIVTPLLLITVLFIFWLADRVTSSRQARMDAFEDKVTLLITEEIENRSAGDWNDLFETLKTKHAGWEFIALENQELLAATLPVSPRDLDVLKALPLRLPNGLPREHRMSFESSMYAVKDWFWITKFRSDQAQTSVDIVLLYSAKYGEKIDAQLDRQDEMVAMALTVGLILIAFWYSSRLSRRLAQIQRQVRAIAEGGTTQTVDERGSDEISDLARSVNLMASELSVMKQQVAQAERSRLHAQLGRGIAHELRNGIHSARLALEMFREDHDDSSRSSLLTTCYDQLCVTEHLVRRLLNVGQPEHRVRTSRPLRAILEDVIRLASPMFRHAQVQFTSEVSMVSSQFMIEDAESIQSAIINLCINAIEAAGPDGRAELKAHSDATRTVISVSDSGPGPAESVAETLFEPFVTTKPEGVGLGLVHVQQAAKDAGGGSHWMREEGRTMFWIQLPAEKLPLSASPPVAIE